MIERTKKLRESAWFWFFLTVLSIVGFTGSTIGFFSNSSITSVGRVVYLAVAGPLIVLTISLAVVAYNAWLQGRVNASVEMVIRQLLTDLERLGQTDEHTTELIRSFLSKPRTDVDVAPRRLEEIVRKGPIDALTMIRESHRENVYQAFENNARAFGLFCEFQKVDCFVDQQGLVRITRHVKLAAYTSVQEFYVYLLLPEKNQEGVFVSPRVECIDSSHNLEAGPPVWFFSKQTSKFRINPPLGPGDSIEFKLYEGSTTQVFRTPWKHKKSKTRDDYVFWDITYPTRQLTIAINLPEGMDIAGTTVDAIYSVGAESPPRHIQEYDRIKDTAIDIGHGTHVLCLTVERPILSVKYKLGWLPRPDYAEPEPQGH